MSLAWNLRHESLSGRATPENPPAPPAEGAYSDYSPGNSLDDETFEPIFPISPKLLADALAIYHGETPSKEWNVDRLASKRNLVRRLGRTSLPELTPDILQVLHPDILEGYDHIEEHNSSNVLERALVDLLCNIVDDYQGLQEVRNPRYRAELHAAQRRTIVYMLSLAGVHPERAPKFAGSPCRGSQEVSV